MPNLLTPCSLESAMLFFNQYGQIWINSVKFDFLFLSEKRSFNDAKEIFTIVYEFYKIVLTN